MILDSDRIMVLSDGEIAELGSPADLRSRQDGTSTAPQRNGRAGS